MKKELLKGLTDEQIKKVMECKNSDEILALAKAEGVQLNEEQLEAVSGGACYDGYTFLACPKCDNVCANVGERYSHHYICDKCGHEWWTKEQK